MRAAATIDDFAAAMRARGPRLSQEFQVAFAAMPDGELRDWARTIPAVALEGVVRRGRGLKNAATKAIEVSQREWQSGQSAWRQSRLLPHLKDRAAATTKAASDLAAAGRAIATAYTKTLAKNPRTEAPILAARVFGFMAGSGGLDGDGGIPDLDLLGGIGDHRSLLTHTVVAGIVTETVVLAFVDLAGRLYDYLPLEHDPLWEYLDQRDSRIIAALLGGVSAGLAYHFAVDATADSGGAYAATKGIIPPAGDDLLQAANALAEILAGLPGRLRTRPRPQNS
jgi:hypothetical protein